MHHRVDCDHYTEQFHRAWLAAIRSLQEKGGDQIKWMAPSLESADGCHQSFYYGNQLYFMFINMPSCQFDERRRELFLESADGANAIPCVMTLVARKGTYIPHGDNWALQHAYDSADVYPPELCSDERFVMTDWELQCQSVQLVQRRLEAEGITQIKLHYLSDVFPSLAFTVDDSALAVLVRSARFPDAVPTITNDIHEAKSSLGSHYEKVFFAPVLCAGEESHLLQRSADDPTIFRKIDICMAYSGMEEIE
jgi:hypothetical protein